MQFQKEKGQDLQNTKQKPKDWPTIKHTHKRVYSNTTKVKKKTMQD